MPFGITGLGGFAAQAPEDFPRFLQWQQAGVDLGDNAVETVNVTGNITATRGSGEASGTLTLDVADTPVVDVDAALIYAGPASGAAAPAAFRALVATDLPALNWREVPGDGSIETADVDNGLAFTGTTGTSTLTINPGDIPEGRSLLVLQEGAAPVQIAVAGGATLLYRSAAFAATTAGEGAIVTLIARDATRFILCGDLEAL